MWTITNEQLTNMSQSMREEFEKRMLIQFEKMDYISDFPRNYIQDIIHKQTILAISFEINRRDLIMIFVKYSFQYLILQQEGFDEKIMELLSSNDIDEARKIQRLINRLKTNAYVSEY